MEAIAQYLPCQIANVILISVRCAELLFYGQKQRQGFFKLFRIVKQLRVVARPCFFRIHQRARTKRRADLVFLVAAVAVTGGKQNVPCLAQRVGICAVAAFNVVVQPAVQVDFSAFGQQRKLQVINHGILLDAFHEKSRTDHICTALFKLHIRVFAMYGEFALHGVLAAEIVQHARYDRISPKVAGGLCAFGIEVKDQKTVFRNGFHNVLAQCPCLHDPNGLFVKFAVQAVDRLPDTPQIEETVFGRCALVKRVARKKMVIA